MLKKVINNYIYEKSFKNIGVKEIKNYFFKKINKSIIYSTISFLVSSSILYLINKLLSSTRSSDLILDKILNMLVAVPIMFILLFSLATLVFSTMSFFEYSYKFVFFKNKIKKDIESQNFQIKSAKNENKEIQYFSENNEFIANKINKILSKKLTKNEIDMLLKEFIENGSSEENIKDILKERMKNKSDLNITLEDLCFIIEEMNHIENKKAEKEKIKKINKIVENLSLNHARIV